MFSKIEPDKEKERPLVYISMGTVINDRPDFYAKCIDALKDEKVDVIISCGNALDISVLGELPENIKVYPYVDQLDVLSRVDAFIDVYKRQLTLCSCRKTAYFSLCCRQRQERHFAKDCG